MKRRVLSMFELLQKPISACLSRTFFDESDAEEEKLREALLIAQHTQCWEGKVDSSVAAASVKKALAPWLEVTALDRVEHIAPSKNNSR